MTGSPSITLNNGVSIPQVGLGVFQVPPDDAQRVVENALEAGYRHIDTAAAYNNEAGVGAAIKACGLAARGACSSPPSCATANQGYDEALAAYDDSCERLGLDQIDLYLIHWPYPVRGPLRRQLAGAGAALRGAAGPGDRGVELPARAPGAAVSPKPRRCRPSTRSSCTRPSSSATSPTSARTLDRRRGVLAARTGRRSGAPDGRRARRELRQDPGPGRAALARAARSHRDPEVQLAPTASGPTSTSSSFSLTDDELNSITAMESGNRIGSDPSTFALSQIR